MCNGILNDPRVLCQPFFAEFTTKHIFRILSPNQPFFAEFITKHIFRVLSPNQPLYQELKWDEMKDTICTEKLSLSSQHALPSGWKMAPRSFCPQHTDEETSSSSWNVNILASLWWPQLSLAPTSASLRPPKPSSWQQNVLGNGKRLGLCFNRLIFLLIALLGPHGRLGFPK